MKPTELVYMLEMQLLNDTATIQAIQPMEDGKIAIILDKTIFYPQGGGQPADHGTIKKGEAVFRVDDVRFTDGLVYHKGAFESGELNVGDVVECQVDETRRSLNSRLHSAGHLLDYGLLDLKIELEPGKGYHFPDSPYVEYIGTLDEALKEKIQKQLEEAVNKIVEADLPVEVRIVEHGQLAALCKSVPDYLPAGKPARLMMVHGYPGIPCGGTHVQSTDLVGKVKITAI